MSQTDPRIQSFTAEADKVLTFLHSEYAKLQTGRANAALVEGVTIDAYGAQQPLKNVAGITVEDARTIVIQPWDATLLQETDKALQKADLGCNPVNDGQKIRICLPPMTEERRKQLTKVVDQLAEEGRISVRQQRQKIHDDIKKNESDEDVRYTLLEELEKAVKQANDEIEQTRKKKDEEVMTV